MRKRDLCMGGLGKQICRFLVLLMYIFTTTSHAGLIFEFQGNKQAELNQDGKISNASINDNAALPPSSNALIFDYQGQVALWAENDHTINFPENFEDKTSAFPETGILIDNPLHEQVAEILSLGRFYIAGEKRQLVFAVSNADATAVFEWNPGISDYELKYQNITVPGGFEGRVEYPTYDAVYYIKDHLGSVREVVNEQGEMLESIQYHSYGNQEYTLTSSVKARESFTGKEFDEDGAVNGAAGIGLYYFGARYFDPEVGIWTSMDPSEQSWSPYGYGGNGTNPISFVDKDGRELVSGAIIIIGAVIGAVTGGITAYSQGVTLKEDAGLFFGYVFIGAAIGAATSAAGAGAGGLFAGQGIAGGGLGGLINVGNAFWSSLLGGAVNGALMGLASGFVSGFLNTLAFSGDGPALFQGNVTDALKIGCLTALYEGAIGAVGGAIHAVNDKVLEKLAKGGVDGVGISVCKKELPTGTHKEKIKSGDLINALTEKPKKLYTTSNKLLEQAVQQQTMYDKIMRGFFKYSIGWLHNSDLIINSVFAGIMNSGAIVNDIYSISAWKFEIGIPNKINAKWTKEESDYIKLPIKFKGLNRIFGPILWNPGAAYYSYGRFGIDFGYGFGSNGWGANLNVGSDKTGVNIGGSY